MNELVIIITCASLKEANKISKKLLDMKLVACTNIIEGVNSAYWWKGKIENSKETLITAKTIKNNFKKVVEEVKKIHSYEVPEIIALPIVYANQDYLKWIRASLKKVR